MPDLSDFIFIGTEEATIGLPSQDADLISLRIKEIKIKKEHIAASVPLVKVKNEPFYISKKLVTVSEFRKFVVDTSYKCESEQEGWGWIWENSWKKREGVSWEKPFGDEADQLYIENSRILPVMQVSWNDAVAYTKWRTGIEKTEIRLPSEAEWEIFAGMSGVKSMRSAVAGTQLEISNSLYFVKLLLKKFSDSDNNLGLLWEWTSDWYKGYSPDVKQKDFGEVYKVLRGGSLLSEDIQKSKEFRFRRCPTARSPYYGFRIVFSKA